MRAAVALVDCVRIAALFQALSSLALSSQALPRQNYTGPLTLTTETGEDVTMKELSIQVTSRVQHCKET